jgi:hypothetical protein
VVSRSDHHELPVVVDVDLGGTELSSARSASTRSATRARCCGRHPVVAALGALGRPFYDGNLDEQLAAKASLASIPDWTAGQRWNGLAGKITPSGAFSVGSGKEAGHSTFPRDQGAD